MLWPVVLIKECWQTQQQLHRAACSRVLCLHTAAVGRVLSLWAGFCACTAYTPRPCQRRLSVYCSQGELLWCCKHEAQHCCHFCTSSICTQSMQVRACVRAARSRVGLLLQQQVGCTRPLTHPCSCWFGKHSAGQQSCPSCTRFCGCLNSSIQSWVFFLSAAV